MRNKSNSASGIGFLTLLPLVLLSVSCGGGGASGGGDSSGSANPPPAQVASFDCAGFTVWTPTANNMIILTLPPGQPLPSTVSRQEIQKWTACLFELGQIVGSYEHIFFFNETGDVPDDATYSGTSFMVSNFVQGVGVSQFENWSDWGVTGTLKSVLHFPSIENFVLGPKLHELAHHVANFTMQGNEDSGWSGHWGFSSANGQLGGFDAATLIPLGAVSAECTNAYSASHTPIVDPANPFFGPNGNGGDSLPYSMIELYLLGMAAPAELPPEILIAPGAHHLPGSFNVFCAPNGFLAYPTQSWLESRLGPRVPDAFNTSTISNVLFVMVEDGVILSSDSTRWFPLDAICEIRSFAREEPNEQPFDFNYYEATLGRAVIRVPLTNAICPGCLFNEFGISRAELADSCINNPQ